MLGLRKLVFEAELLNAEGSVLKIADMNVYPLVLGNEMPAQWGICCDP